MPWPLRSATFPIPPTLSSLLTCVADRAPLNELRNRQTCLRMEWEYGTRSVRQTDSSWYKSRVSLTVLPLGVSLFLWVSIMCPIQFLVHCRCSVFVLRLRSACNNGQFISWRAGTLRSEDMSSAVRQIPVGFRICEWDVCDWLTDFLQTCQVQKRATLFWNNNRI
jgi:hypothetical protein